MALEPIAETTGDRFSYGFRKKRRTMDAIRHNGKLQRSRTEVVDLIMNIVGPPLGKLAIIPTTLPQANFNQAAVLIRPYKFKEVLEMCIRDRYKARAMPTRCF